MPMGLSKKFNVWAGKEKASSSWTNMLKAEGRLNYEEVAARNKAARKRHLAYRISDQPPFQANLLKGELVPRKGEFWHLRML